MGQGTDSCGGYDVDCDTYDEGLNSGIWTQKNGAGIHVSNMTLSHLQGARRVAERAAARASFEDQRDTMQAWVDLFDDEISARLKRAKKAAKALASSAVAAPLASPCLSASGASAVKPAVKNAVRGTTAQMKCHCGQVYLAREADLARGWAKSCSKSCAAIRRDYGRPAAMRVPVASAIALASA